MSQVRILSPRPFLHGAFQTQGLLDHREAQVSQVTEGSVVELRTPRRVPRVTRRHEDNHPLAGSSQQYPVGVPKIVPSLRLADLTPSIAGERMATPFAGDGPEVSIPSNAGPVEFKPLDLK